MEACQHSHLQYEKLTQNKDNIYTPSQVHFYALELYFD